LSASRDRGLRAAADACRIGRVELGFERMDHPRVDRAGADRIDADPLARDLAGGGLDKADHRVLLGAIGGHARGRDQPRHRSGVDDRAPLLLQHNRQYVAQAEEDAPDAASSRRPRYSESRLQDRLARPQRARTIRCSRTCPGTIAKMRSSQKIPARTQPRSKIAPGL